MLVINIGLERNSFTTNLSSNEITVVFPDPTAWVRMCHIWGIYILVPTRWPNNSGKLSLLDLIQVSLIHYKVVCVLPWDPALWEWAHLWWGTWTTRFGTRPWLLGRRRRCFRNQVKLNVRQAGLFSSYLEFDSLLQRLWQCLEYLSVTHTQGLK